jgi:hypothetical protein
MRPDLCKHSLGTQAASIFIDPQVDLLIFYHALPIETSKPLSTPVHSIITVFFSQKTG